MAAERVTNAAGETVAKQCSMCGVMKPLTDYRRYTGRSKDGHYGCCKDCHRDADNRRYAARRSRR